MNNRCIVLENIRSAYNVGTIIRTADALGYDVVLSGYTPNPETEEKVRKTSLGAEAQVTLLSFWNPDEAILFLQKEGYQLIAAECTADSVSLETIQEMEVSKKIALIVGNEKTGVFAATLQACRIVTHIPMRGVKESLNVAEAAAIVMREMRERGEN